MILNTYAILTLFVGVIRLGVAALLLLLTAGVWRRVASRTDTEQRGYLVFLLTFLLLALNLVSWPLLYLLWQSYVPEWPGIMCLYGVTRIGADSTGISRHLPGLVTLLQVSKPALVFAGGLWFVLYLLNRQTRTSPLVGRLFAVLAVVGVLAVVDAAAEFAYVVMPKKEIVPTSGCCTQAMAESRFVPSSPLAAIDPAWLTGAYYGGSVALMLTLAAASLSPQRVPGRWMLTMVTAFGGFVFALGGVFLVDVAAPRLLGLPYHHCPYDLIERVPESIVAVALLVAGGFALGWAALAAWIGRDAETRLSEAIWVLLRVSLWCQVAGLLMLSLELYLA